MARIRGRLKNHSVTIHGLTISRCLGDWKKENFIRRHTVNRLASLLGEQ